MTTALEGGEGSASRPGRCLPPGKTQHRLEICSTKDIIMRPTGWNLCSFPLKK